MNWLIDKKTDIARLGLMKVAFPTRSIGLILRKSHIWMVIC